MGLVPPPQRLGGVAGPPRRIDGDPLGDTSGGGRSGSDNTPMQPRPTSSDPDPNISYGGGGGGMRTTAGSGVVDPDPTEQTGGGPGVLDPGRMGNGPEAARG